MANSFLEVGKMTRMFYKTPTKVTLWFFFSVSKTVLQETCNWIFNFFELMLVKSWVSDLMFVTYSKRSECTVKVWSPTYRGSLAEYLRIWPDPFLRISLPGVRVSDSSQQWTSTSRIFFISWTQKCFNWLSIFRFFSKLP